MEKHFVFNYHSFIDVITNSSSEIFMTSDQKIVEFFKELLSNHPETNYSAIKVLSYEEFAEKYDFEGIKESEPEYFEKTYGTLKEGDMILTIRHDSEDYDLIPNLTKLLNMREIYD